jgi:dolichyl-phosphate beta-glucosyltransferase
MFLSIIIPAYNEWNKISYDIQNVQSFFKNHLIEGELIIVDDGSSDDTVNIAKQTLNELQINSNVLKLNKNIGKGAAVREGILFSKGKFILYTDAGSTVPLDYIIPGLEMIETGNCDIANGSRKLPDSRIIIEQDWDRKFIARLFLWMVKKLYAVPKNLTDTQCGFKLYKGNVARELFSNLKTDGFLFEIEIILMAIKKNYVIREFPVEWRCDRDSRISIWNSSLSVLKDLIKIRQTYG